MALQATEAGVAHVGVYWPYDWDWWISAVWLSGHTHGACQIVVQDGFSGAVLGPVGTRTVGFWSHTSQTGADGTDSGTVYNPDIEATVNLTADQVFNVTLLATAYVDDSPTSLPGLGWSSAHAGLRMRVPFFTVRMGIP
jgi:hypothetical protein